MIPLHRTFMLTLVAATLASTAAARAEDFARTEEHARKSMLSGAGAATALPTFRRQAGRLQLSKELLLARLCKARCEALATEELGDRLRVKGEGWKLDLYGDGSMAELTDDAVGAKAQQLAVSPAQKMSLPALEAAGRKYIASHLAQVITLAPGETLVARTAAYRTEAGMDRRGVRSPDRITAQRIMFTREIAGRPVVGPGSKVTITFLSDLSVESFRYDWSTYAPSGEPARVVDVEAILERVQRVTLQRTNHPAAGTLPLPARPATGATGPRQLGGNLELERLECGYYDPGLPSRGASSLLQPACYYHALHRSDGAPATHAGLAGAVPMALQPVADDTWMEEAQLRGLPPRAHLAPPGARTSR